MKRINEGNDVNKELGIEVVLLSPRRSSCRSRSARRFISPTASCTAGVRAHGRGRRVDRRRVSVGPDEIVVGTELNCSHLRSMSSGTLTATATPVRKGRTVHVWAIDLTDETGRMICIARCTLQVLKAPAAPSA